MLASDIGFSGPDDIRTYRPAPCIWNDSAHRRNLSKAPAFLSKTAVSKILISAGCPISLTAV
jgi:hypothetical protein